MFRWLILIYIVVRIGLLTTCFRYELPKNLRRTFGLAISFSFSIPEWHRNEIVECMQHNHNVLSIHVLLDGPKNECARLKGLVESCRWRGPDQPSYYEMVRFASSLPVDFVVLSNADIMFDTSIMASLTLAPRQAFAISWSSDDDGNSMCRMPNTVECGALQPTWVLNCWPARLFSIDSFVFRRDDLAEISSDGFSDVQGQPFAMNRPDAEFAFVGAVESHGIGVTNACRFIKTQHHHQSPKSYHPMPPLFTKYGIYREDVGNRKELKTIIFHGVAGKNEYKLPLGI
jgi:hypothetical protein